MEDFGLREKVIVEKGSNVRVKNEVHLLSVDPDAKRVQRIVLSTPRSKPVAEPKEFLLINAVQHLGGRPSPQVGAVCHRPWVCTFGATAAPGMLPDGPAKSDQ